MLRHSRHNPALPTSLREAAALCLAESDPAGKCAMVAALATDGSVVGDVRTLERNTPVGRPTKPRLVDPRELPRRQLGNPVGHAAFVHAICHIEFTAINLALDAAVRFNGMPDVFYRDWLKVAGEEAEHYSLLASHLLSLGYGYGDFDAHDGLWDMAERTAHDLLRRMALVPRVMEARGLDVTPGMIKRLDAIGDRAGVAILERILHDEIRHVAIGSRWFEYLCRRDGHDPESTFVELVAQEFGRLRMNAMNRDARLAAGFSADELDRLSGDELAPRA